MITPLDPFSLLKNTVNVLVVDDDRGILDILEMHLSFFQIYSVSRASSTAKAIMKIEASGSRFHVCVLDRGLYDVEGNEFYLMDKYRQKIPFIVITGRKDSEKAFECGEHGGKKVLSKGGPDFLKNLFPSINVFALKSIVCPGCHEFPSPFLSACYDTLVEKKPLSVKALAKYLHMSDRSLRNGCMKYTGMDPKYSICLFHLYSRVFECIEKVGCNGSEDDLKNVLQKCLKTMIPQKALADSVDIF